MAVKLFHPGFQRLRLTAITNSFQALSQMPRADGQLWIPGIEIVKGSLKIKHRGRHFHRQLNSRGLPGAGGHVYRT